MSPSCGSGRRQSKRTVNLNVHYRTNRTGIAGDWVVIWKSMEVEGNLGAGLTQKEPLKFQN